MAAIRFTRTVQPLKCPSCGKVTTNYEQSTMTLAPDMRTKLCVCMPCYEEQGLLNAHSDGYHRDEPCADCPDCKTEKPTARKSLKTLAAEAKKERAMPRTRTVMVEDTDTEDMEVEPVEVEETEEVDAPAKKVKATDPRVLAAKEAAQAAREAHAAAVKALADAKATRKATLAALMEANKAWADVTRKVHMERAARETGKAATELVPAA